ncbi:PilN domain-containing protein [Vibrio sinaloensis]|uniref:PilN domain-containing protein n=1 Tax=Photobacterium sp. (strain ATCC 43367) TaxID=379097 RepID=UPI00205186F0|nr:PilN domain-containing protein [Vibrio sinaloensis]UPQ88180.1 PilN domain-containing protein [Vibrio sinaloensis]
MSELVNLFPWRQQQRAYLRRRFLIFTLVSVLLPLGWQLQVEHQWSERRQVIEARSQDLLEQLNQLDGQLIQAEFLQQQQQTNLTKFKQQQQFIAQRGLAAQVLWRLTQVLPEHIYLDELALRGNQITLSGYSAQQAPLTLLLERFHQTQVFHNVVLHSVTEQQSRQRFSLSLQYVSAVQHHEL